MGIMENGIFYIIGSWCGSLVDEFIGCKGF